MLLLFAKRVREREHKHGRGEKENSVRGFSHQIFRSFSLSFFYFFEKRGKGEREVCVVFALRFFWSDKAKEEGDFDLRETLVSDSLMRKRRKKKLVVCFLTVRESERVRETIIVSSSAAAAWHKVVVVVVVVEVEMA